MVLRTAERLNALSVLRASLVYVLSNRRRANERDCVNAWVGEETVNGLFVAVEDSEHAIGKTSFLPELGEPNRGRGILLRRLQDDRVSRSDRDGEEPHGDHRGEVER